VIRRIGDYIGSPVDYVYGLKGIGDLRTQIPRYNKAAHFSPWVVLVDLDRTNCAPHLCRSLLPAPERFMHLRVAVREVESWLLADRERFAEFFKVAVEKIPGDPDSEVDPKMTVLKLVQRSRRREIRDDMVPRIGSGRVVGPAYASRLIEFAGSSGGWRPQVAELNSDSLRRCISSLRQIGR
jgi:hypothetical protein